MSQQDLAVPLTERALTERMLDPRVYPGRPEKVGHLETHISRLFFAGDRVVKIKRPVNYGFVDHQSLASRRQSCADEIRLNRLLSDDIYLACEPIVRTPDGLRLGGDGDPVEWATVMRRLPANAMLDTILASGPAPDDLAVRLAQRLIPFHRSARPCPGCAREQAAEAERVLRENLSEIAGIDSTAVFSTEFSMIAAVVRGYLDAHAGAIQERASAGWIREGHGDLKCEHIVLDPPGSLQVYDCVEFSIAIRCADVASDLAFLLLDLERLGARPVAAELVERYRQAGVDLPDTMLTLYRIHRALVRVKVSALTIQSATAEADLHVARHVTEWLHRASASAFRLRTVVLAMTGLSGTGKSVVADDIREAFNLRHFSTDAIRAELMAHDARRYDPANRLEIYRQMIDRARAPLQEGQPVLLDGAFLRDEERTLAQRLAREAGCPLVFVEVVADPAVVERRIVERAAQGDAAHASEATFDVLRAQRAQQAMHPAVIPESTLRVTIDTSRDQPASLDALFSLFQLHEVLEPALT